MEFANRTDQRKNDRRYREGYRCTRHRNPDEVLSGEVPTRTRTLIASRSTRYNLPKNLFWFEEGTETGSGFVYGPGFKAYADDFPEGTRLTITAQIDPPATSE